MPDRWKSIVRLQAARMVYFVLIQRASDTQSNNTAAERNITSCDVPGINYLDRHLFLSVSKFG